MGVLLVTMQPTETKLLVEVHDLLLLHYTAFSGQEKHLLCVSFCHSGQAWTHVLRQPGACASKHVLVKPSCWKGTLNAV